MQLNSCSDLIRSCFPVALVTWGREILWPQIIRKSITSSVVPSSAYRSPVLLLKWLLGIPGFEGISLEILQQHGLKGALSRHQKKTLEITSYSWLIPTYWLGTLWGNTCSCNSQGETKGGKAICIIWWALNQPSQKPRNWLNLLWSFPLPHAEVSSGHSCISQSQDVIRAVLKIICMKSKSVMCGINDLGDSKDGWMDFQSAMGALQAKFPAPAVKPSVNPSVLRGWHVVWSVSVCQGRVGW